jgi:hypothetical protein
MLLRTPIRSLWNRQSGKLSYVLIAAWYVFVIGISRIKISSSTTGGPTGIYNFLSLSIPVFAAGPGEKTSRGPVDCGLAGRSDTDKNTVPARRYKKPADRMPSS